MHLLQIHFQKLNFLRTASLSGFAPLQEAKLFVVLFILDTPSVQTISSEEASETKPSNGESISRSNILSTPNVQPPEKDPQFSSAEKRNAIEILASLSQFPFTQPLQPVQQVEQGINHFYFRTFSQSV